MIGPNFPPTNSLRPLFAPADPTLSNPGFFDQAIMPVFSDLGLGSLGGMSALLPMMPLQIPGFPMPGAGPAAEGKKAEKGKKGSEVKADKGGMPLVSKKMQEDYVKSIYATFLQGSLELNSNFGMFLGAPPRA